jgi:hypothetical protein
MWKAWVLGLSVAAVPLLAQGPVDLRGMARTWQDLGQPAGHALSLELEAAGVTILPSPDGHVRTRYVGTKDHDLSRLRIRFHPAAQPAELRVSHTPHNDFQYEIQIPRTIDLTLRMSAGELKIVGIEGNKDLRLHAGEVIVQVGEPKAYGPVSASVWAGEIRPGPFGEGEEGLFRTFSHDGPGRYSLRVKVKAGQVTFER